MLHILFCYLYLLNDKDKLNLVSRYTHIRLTAVEALGCGMISRNIEGTDDIHFVADFTRLQEDTSDGVIWSISTEHDLHRGTGLHHLS